MPMYHYRCRNCGYEYEIQQRISDSALTDCPNCQTAGLERVISASGGFILKGTGFYNTDYKNAPAAKSDTPSTAAPKSDTPKSDAPKSDVGSASPAAASVSAP